MKRSRWLEREALPPLPFMTLCLTKKDFDKVLLHLKQPTIPWLNPGADATMHTFEHPTSGLTCVVCLKTRTGITDAAVTGLLVHEGVHIWQAYRDDVLRERLPSSELEAYCIQSIAQKLVTAYKELRHGRHS